MTNLNTDPNAIADWLIQNHGRDTAREMAFQGLYQAQHEEDNYAVSVWREVRHILSAESPAGLQAARLTED